MLRHFILLASNIPAALIGGGLFLLALLGFRLDLPIALLIGVGGDIIAGLLIFPAKPARELQQQELLKTVLHTGNRQLAHMRSLLKQIPDRAIQQKVKGICDVTENVFEAVKKNPHHARSAQQFSSYYLDTTLKIIKKYIELSEHKAYSHDVNASLTKVERMLGDIHLTFEKQLSALLRDDVLDLDTELSVLEETIELE